jgi:hypothetical protein
MAVPVTNGLILNFQSDNIDGSNNATLTDGQEITQWNDIVEAGGNTTANNATDADGKAYLDATNNNTGTPNFVAITATGAPGVLFTRGASQDIGDALGFNGAINGLSTTGGITAFVVGDFNSTAATAQPQRAMQLGHAAGNNLRVVGFGNDGFRFNNNSKIYTQDMETGGAHIATYTMTLNQPIGASGSNANYRYDGADGTFKSGGLTTDTLTVANQGFALGAGQNNSSAVIDSLNGTLYAMLLYSRVLTPTEVGQVETFLNQKFVAIPEASAWMLWTAVSACAGLVYRQKVVRRWKPA